MGRRIEHTLDVGVKSHLAGQGLYDPFENDVIKFLQQEIRVAEFTRSECARIIAHATEELNSPAVRKDPSTRLYLQRKLLPELNGIQAKMDQQVISLKHALEQEGQPTAADQKNT